MVPRPRHAYIPSEKTIDASVTIKQAIQHTKDDGGVEVVHYHPADEKCDKEQRHRNFINGKEI